MKKREEGQARNRSVLKMMLTDMKGDRKECDSWQAIKLCREMRPPFKRVRNQPQT